MCLFATQPSPGAAQSSQLGPCYAGLWKTFKQRLPKDRRLANVCGEYYCRYSQVQLLAEKAQAGHSAEQGIKWSAASMLAPRQYIAIYAAQQSRSQPLKRGHAQLLLPVDACLAVAACRYISRPKPAGGLPHEPVHPLLARQQPWACLVLRLSQPRLVGTPRPRLQAESQADNERRATLNNAGSAGADKALTNTPAANMLQGAPRAQQLTIAAVHPHATDARKMLGMVFKYHGLVSSACPSWTWPLAGLLSGCTQSYSMQALALQLGAGVPYLSARPRRRPCQRG
jgi:hypothetical protein